MTFFISGGLGFVGTYLSRYLLERGHRILATGRRPDPMTVVHNRFEYISTDTTQPGVWQEALKQIDTVINLSGSTIYRRWTETYKKTICHSRIETTKNIVDQLTTQSPVTLVNASAVGYYGDRGDETIDEEAPPGNDFLARVAINWEQEALRAEGKGARVVCGRFGIVLGRGGGVIEKMLPAFRNFVGGPQGNGRQWFPWIHMEDLCGVIEFVLNTPKMSGPINFCAPHPVRNRELAQAMGRIMKRPAFMRVPAFMLRMILGEFGTALLSSQRCVPKKLIASGYRFKYPEIAGALENLVSA